MQDGAIAVMDALGFRDLWRHVDSREALERMKKLVAGMRERSRAWDDINEVNMPDVNFLSDTVVISLRQEGLSLKMALQAVTMAASALMTEALDAEPHLLYRGCITVGDFAVQDRFIIGPAVSAAAPVAENAQGAFVWLDPRACAAFGPMPEDWATTHNMLRWAVPLKGGDRFTTWAVAPFGIFHRKKERQTLMEKARRVFAREPERLDVQIKAQHTMAFLEAADQAAAVAWNRGRLGPDD